MRAPDANCERWKQLLRWFIYICNVGKGRVRVSLGWINPGNSLIPLTMNLGSLHHICSKGIHKHCLMDSDRLHMCHDHCRNAWKSCLGVVFSADDEACHVVNKGLISPRISSFPCYQLLTSFVWIPPRENIYISGRIQSSKCLVKYLLGCLWPRLRLILLL